MKIILRIICVVLIGIFVVWAYLQKEHVEEAMMEANRQTNLAREAQKDAERLEEEAIRFAEDAIREKNKAEAAREEAETLMKELLKCQGK